MKPLESKGCRFCKCNSTLHPIQLIDLLGGTGQKSKSPPVPFLMLLCEVRSEEPACRD